MKYRRWILAVLCCCVLAPPAGLARDEAGAPLRLAVPGVKPREFSKDEPSEGGVIRALVSRGTRVRVGEPGNGETDVFLLPDDSAEKVAGWSTERIRAVAASVRENGRGLVVVGRAASALAESAEYSALLGREREAAVPAEEPARSGGLRLAIVDQAHPVTECLTHVLLDQTRFTATGAESVNALGVTLAPRATSESSLETPVTVAWTRRHGRGRVVVIAISSGREPDEKVLRLLDVLTARAVLHAADRRSSVPLPGDLPLAAERVKVSAAGGLEGFPVLEGFYLGRRIAPVMSHRGADWLTREDREATEKPERVLEALGIRTGATVADLGAGNGYFTLRLARRVGPEGKVLAIDIQKEMLQRLRKRANEAGLANIEPVLATEKDPGLPENAVDLVLLVDVYHELSHARAVTSRVRKALARKSAGRPAGRLVLVEYRGEDPAVPILPLHRMTLDQTRAEMKVLGFRWKSTHEFLPHQRVIEFVAAP